MMFTKGILYSYYTIISLYIQLTNILLEPPKREINIVLSKFFFQKCDIGINYLLIFYCNSKVIALLTIGILKVVALFDLKSKSEMFSATFRY